MPRLGSFLPRPSTEERNLRFREGRPGIVGDLARDPRAIRATVRSLAGRTVREEVVARRKELLESCWKSRPQAPCFPASRAPGHRHRAWRRYAGARHVARAAHLRKRVSRATAAHHERLSGVDGLRAVLRRRAFRGTAAKNQSVSSSACFRWGHGRFGRDPERAWEHSRSSPAPTTPPLPLATTWLYSDPPLRETLS